MATTSLTIQVSEEVARAFTRVLPEDQQKIQLLLDLRLRDLTISPLSRKSLQAVMDEFGKNAAGQTRRFRNELDVLETQVRQLRRQVSLPESLGEKKFREEGTIRGSSL